MKRLTKAAEAALREEEHPSTAQAGKAGLIPVRRLDPMVEALIEARLKVRKAVVATLKVKGKKEPPSFKSALETLEVIESQLSSGGSQSSRPETEGIVRRFMDEVIQGCNGKERKVDTERLFKACDDVRRDLREIHGIVVEDK